MRFVASVVPVRGVAAASILASTLLIIGQAAGETSGRRAVAEPSLVTGIDVAFIHSAHGKELGAWYAETLGLPVAKEVPGWTELEMPGGSRFAVDHTGFPRSVVESQPVVLSFRVEDIRKAVAALAAKGVRFRPSPEKAVYDVGSALVATFEDPDGNFVQLSQPTK